MGGENGSAKLTIQHGSSYGFTDFSTNPQDADPSEIELVNLRVERQEEEIAALREEINRLKQSHSIEQQHATAMLINILIALATVYIVYKLFLVRYLSHEQIQDRVQGKVMLITGAARGFGRDFALKFAACGAKLVLVDLRAEMLQQTAEDCKKLGADVHYIAADLCDSNNYKKIVDDTVAKFQKLDHLVLNHGILPVKPVRDMTPELVEKILLGNQVSHALIAKHSLEHLIQAKGQISVMSSTSAYLAICGYSPYCSSKAGLRGFFESLRLEVEDHGVKVAMIYPGPTTTDLLKEVFSPSTPFYQRMIFTAPERVTPGIIDAIARGKRSHYTDMSTRIMAFVRFFFAPPVDMIMKYIRY